jgi:3-deoxy-D-manno-octulosonic-acid transferase
MECVVLTFKERFARFLYTVALICLLPVLAGYLIRRGFRQPEYFKHWSERFLGLAVPRPRHEPAGAPFENQEQCKVLWVHAVSVGETRACAPLIDQWLEQDPSHRVVLTHTTPTGRDTGRALFSKWFESQDRKSYRIVQRYLPYDLPWSNALFLNWARPSAGLFMETELWPNLLAQAKARGIPIMLANARLSLRSVKRFETFQALARPAIASLAMIAAQTQEDANRLLKVTASVAVHVTGSMKFDITVPQSQQQLGDQWRAQLGDIRVWLAASTRDDEEVELLKAWQSVQNKAELNNNVLLIVPRHPQRFDRVARLIEQQGFTAVRRSLQWLEDPHIFKEPKSQTPVVLLGDSLGEMFAYLQLADLALIGGSIPALGGQNPIEACALGKPVFFGPHMFNFTQIARELQECGAGCEISSYAQWIAQGGRLFNDPAAFEAKRQAGVVFSNTHRGATQRTLELLKTIL